MQAQEAIRLKAWQPVIVDDCPAQVVGIKAFYTNPISVLVHDVAVRNIARFPWWSRASICWTAYTVMYLLQWVPWRSRLEQVAIQIREYDDINDWTYRIVNCEQVEAL